MRTGLSLTIIGSVVLALVGVTVLIGAFSSSFGGVFESGFCRIYTSVSYIFPGETPGPGSCTESTTEYQDLEVSNKDDLALVIASAITNCWDQYKGYFSGPKLCGGFSLNSYTGNALTETYLNQVMIDNDLCPQKIENSQIDEGSGSTVCETNNKNQIRFKKSQFEEGDIVIVKYNATTQTTPPEQWITVS